MNFYKLYYFADPMCGWCYGFQKQIELAESHYPEIPIEIICGGMVINDFEGPIGDKGKYISNAIPRVEELCEVHFGEAFKLQMQEGSLWSGSLKPSIFLNIVKQFGQKTTIAFFHKIQVAYFKNGLSLNEDKTYIPILESLSLDLHEIIKQSAAPVWEKRTRAEFEFTTSVGISGFPTMVLENDEKMMLVSSGFSNFKTINNALDSMLLNEAI